MQVERMLPHPLDLYICLAHIHNGFNTHARKLTYKRNAFHFQAYAEI